MCPVKAPSSAGISYLHDSSQGIILLHHITTMQGLSRSCDWPATQQREFKRPSPLGTQSKSWAHKMKVRVSRQQFDSELLPAAHYLDLRHMHVDSRTGRHGAEDGPR